MVNRALGIWVLLAALIADQLSKAWLLNMGLAGHPLTLTPFFRLVSVWNRGISFGMLAAEDARWMLIGVSLAAVAALFFWLWRGTPRITAWGIGLICGGALGNAIDRLHFGAVADFFDFHWGRRHWPAFNVADSAICVGVALLCVASMLERK